VDAAAGGAALDGGAENKRQLIRFAWSCCRLAIVPSTPAETLQEQRSLRLEQGKNFQEAAQVLMDIRLAKQMPVYVPFDVPEHSQLIEQAVDMVRYNRGALFLSIGLGGLG